MKYKKLIYDISTNIQIIDLFLYLKKEKILIISDPHIGYEEALNKEGIFMPKDNYSEITRRIEKILNEKKVKEIVINGDIIHSFSKVNKREKEQLTKILEILKKYAPITIVKGNHDKIIDFIIKDIPIVAEKKINNILITHGDKISKTTAETIIIGHEHPAVSLGKRNEKYKCFLKGKYKKQNLIVMPSSNTLVEGTDVLRERMQSPYLKNIQDFEVYIIEDQVYDFGTVKMLLNSTDV